MDYKISNDWTDDMENEYKDIKKQSYLDLSYREFRVLRGSTSKHPFLK